MKFFDRLKHTLGGFENLIFKNHSCLCCSCEVSDELSLPLCPDCTKLLDAIDGRVCAVCGEKLSGDVMVCDTCKNENYNFDRNISCFYYTETAAALIKKYKYSSKEYYGEYLAKMMLDKVGEFGETDIITFVPISKSRKRERGFNQAEVLANELSKLTGIPAENLLTKDDGGKHQAGLGRADRLKNLSGTIHFDSSKNDRVRDKRILIVDDVFTTGTTLSVCAAEIKKHKPRSVCTLTFAKTKFVSAKK